MPLARRERELRGLSEVSLQLGSLAMEIGGVRWFLSRGNIIVLEARSILYALRYAGSSCPPGRLLTILHWC